MADHLNFSEGLSSLVSLAFEKHVNDYIELDLRLSECGIFVIFYHEDSYNLPVEDVVDIGATLFSRRSNMFYGYNSARSCFVFVAADDDSACDSVVKVINDNYDLKVEKSIGYGIVGDNVVKSVGDKFILDKEAVYCLNEYLPKPVLRVIDTDYYTKVGTSKKLAVNNRDGGKLFYKDFVVDHFVVCYDGKVKVGYVDGEVVKHEFVWVDSRFSFRYPDVV